MSSQGISFPTIKKEVITYYLYSLEKPITANERIIKRILVSSHCDKHEKHGISKELIIELVQLLDARWFPFSGKQTKNKNYFKDYPEKNDKRYKLVWWWWKEIDAYLWVRTCYPNTY